MGVEAPKFKKILRGVRFAPPPYTPWIYHPTIHSPLFGKQRKKIILQKGEGEISFFGKLESEASQCYMHCSAGRIPMNGNGITTLGPAA